MPMSQDEYLDRLHQLRYTAGLNHRYHHCLEWRWGVADKTVRIVVGILAVVGLVVTIPDVASWFWSMTVAVLSLVAAIVLNVVPLSDKEKSHGELSRRWCDLRGEGELLETKLVRLKPETAITGDLLDRLVGLMGSTNVLHAAETAAFKSLLRRCEIEEALSMGCDPNAWGARDAAEPVAKAGGPGSASAAAPAKEAEAGDAEGAAAEGPAG